MVRVVSSATAYVVLLSILFLTCNCAPCAQINTKLGGVTLLGKGNDAIPVVGGRPFTS